MDTPAAIAGLTRFSSVLVSVELVCAGFLAIAAALDLIGAMGRRQHQRSALVKLLLQSVALILYVVLLLWMGLLVLLSLSGESYMGN